MQACLKLFFIFVRYAKKEVLIIFCYGAKIEHFNLCQRLNIITTARRFLIEKLR